MGLDAILRRTEYLSGPAAGLDIGTSQNRDDVEKIGNRDASREKIVERSRELSCRAWGASPHLD